MFKSRFHPEEFLIAVYDQCKKPLLVIPVFLVSVVITMGLFNVNKRAQAEISRFGKSRLKFVRWQEPNGLFSAEVPVGWRIDGGIGSSMDLGQFKIQGFSPDGLSLFSLAHNWLSFMEYQYGPYRPGGETIEAFILPQFLQQQGGYSGIRIVYRSPTERIMLTNPMTGIPIPFDHGTVGFLLQRKDGGFSAGTAYAETVYIASPGTPGLWRLRLFAAALAPAEQNAQRIVRDALLHVTTSLHLSEQFFTLWQQSFNHTMKQMRRYSAQMDRVFNNYLRSVGRSSSRNGRDPLDGWTSMMRGGRYAVDKTTGEEYWISNDHDYWFVNDRGDVVGNDTGDVPTYGENWRPLHQTWPAPK